MKLDGMPCLVPALFRDSDQVLSDKKSNVKDSKESTPTTHNVTI